MREDGSEHTGGLDEYGGKRSVAGVSEARNLSLFAMVGFVPFLLFFGAASERLFGTAKPMFVAAIAWMVSTLITGNWFIRFRCPR